MPTREPGLYLTHAERYRIVEMPGRAAMRFVEREDGRWRTVAELPEGALAQAQGALPPDQLRAFSDLEPPEGEIGMRDWLAVLETQRDSIRRTLLGLMRNYDAERTFSADPFDMDYDVDLAHSADAALPVLVALEDAIDTVRRCIDRPRGSTRLTVAADVTVGRLLADFAERWAPVRLELFNPSDAYYREGHPDRPDPAEPLSRRTHSEAEAAEIVGTMTPGQVRDTLYKAFNIEAEVYGPDTGETLDAAASRLG